MGKKTRGAWSSADTRSVLFRAAWQCLSRDLNRENVDIKEVLRVASTIWGKEHGVDQARDFTRGAITSNWATMDEFIDAAIIDELGDHGAVTWPAIRDLNADLRRAKYYTALSPRRDEVKVAIGSLIYTTVLNGGTQAQPWDLRMQLFARSGKSDRIRDLFERAESRRRHELTASYVEAVRLAHWKVKPRALAQSHLALIDGALLQLSMNSTLDRHWIASAAQDTGVLVCDGLSSTDVSHEEPVASRSGRERLRIHLNSESSGADEARFVSAVEIVGLEVGSDRLLPADYSPVDEH